MKYILRKPTEIKTDITLFGEEKANEVRNYHKSFPQYTETPLVELKNFAESKGLGNVFIKDESKRFGLNAFKVLGGSFAIGKYLAEKITGGRLDYDFLVSPQARKVTEEITFITATDGNHGRGVAWTATTLGAKAVVYMPKGTVSERLENIRLTGAKADITDMNYDDCVRLADKTARENGWILVQDTAFGDYRDIPVHIMRGYTTMALEAYEQLRGVKPTHIFVQAGVGSMAASVSAFFASVYGADRPKVIVVESEKADCVFRTASADDGTLKKVEGSMDTIMAGLACGEVCPPAWDILSSCADAFVTIPDSYAENGMRTLAKPVGVDSAVTAGESGAAGFSALLGIVSLPENEELRSKLRLDGNSTVLLFNTEGATDRQNYKRITGIEP